ncbi:uncharacterized protein RBU47_013197 [Passerculus sandwichensis]
MGSNSSRSVEIQICNNTQNITLKYYGFYFIRGRCSNQPQPELSPGCSDTCSFWGDSESGGLSGILVYKATSFTLAIHCYNPVDHNQSRGRLGLELSPGKAHLDELEVTYHRMAGGIYSSSDQDIEFARVMVGRSLEIARVSYGPIQVTAAVSCDASSKIKVMLEEQEGPGQEGRAENPFPGILTSRRSVSLQDLLWKPEDSPGSSWMA